MLSVLTGGVAQSVRLNPRPGLKSELQPMTKLEAIRHHEENNDTTPSSQQFLPLIYLRVLCWGYCFLCLVGRQGLLQWEGYQSWGIALTAGS